MEYPDFKPYNVYSEGEYFSSEIARKLVDKAVSLGCGMDGIFIHGTGRLGDYRIRIAWDKENDNERNKEVHEYMDELIETDPFFDGMSVKRMQVDTAIEMYAGK